jgi:predicted molibdopterin-dependent oxidoreductase YjgC
LGLKPFKADDLENLKFIYSIGVDNPTVLEEFKKLTSSTVLLLQSCTGNRTTNFADIVLPSTSFVEHSGVYYNMEGRPQKTQRAFVGPNLARDNWKIIRVVYQILNKSSLYNTKAQLSTLISKILPSYYFADSWFVKSTCTLSMGYTFGQLYPEKLIKSSFKLFIEDFFMTNDLCQSSKVMAKASESLRSYSTNYKFLDHISRRN